ncbi:uncharacterized protein LOC110939819 [Helianthus annuus]|uniref:uncharacterized protein LOC110939819 n=1 Tax=Helianthus annuus TaxID=4232 RepID=UPI000B906574|nr:uncharacterized protein LOC110939819 [Helianthus annuus]
MTEPTKDKEVESNTKGKEKVESADQDDKSASTNSSSSSEDVKKCMDAVDFFAIKAKDIVIGGTKKSEGKSAKSKRRKRSHGGMKRSISLRSGLSEIGMSFDSDSEPTHVAKKEQKGKGKGLEEGDVFQGSDTDDSDEACKRMKKERNNSDDDDSDDGSGAGTGTGSGAHADFSSLQGQGVQVAGK